MKKYKNGTQFTGFYRDDVMEFLGISRKYMRFNVNPTKRRGEKKKLKMQTHLSH